MDPRVATLLKWAVFGLITVFVLGFGSKHYKRHARKNALVSEMRTAVSEASFYRSMTEKDAQAVLLAAVVRMHEAQKLGLEPSAYFDRVFKKDEKKVEGDEFADYPSREQLARETLTRAYQHASQLGLLAGPDEIEALKEGKLPDSVKKVTIARVIDPAISPGLEKVVPNLELRPVTDEVKPPTDIEIAAARNLASDLYSAQIIDREAETRISNHFRPKEEKKK